MSDPKAEGQEIIVNVGDVVIYKQHNERPPIGGSYFHPAMVQHIDDKGNADLLVMARLSNPFCVAACPSGLPTDDAHCWWPRTVAFWADTRKEVRVEHTGG